MAKKRAPAADELFPSLQGRGMIAVDCETKDPDIRTAGPGWHRPGTFIAGVAVGTEDGFRRYYPVAHENDPDNLPKEKVFSWLRQELRTNVPKVGSNLLYDVGFLGNEGVQLGGPLYDIQNAEPLLNEDRFQYGLEYLSRDYLGIGKIDDELDAYLIQHFGRKNPKGNIWRAPSAVVAPYAIGDVNHPLEIFAKQKKLLEQEDLWDLFVLESKLIPMLHAMKRRGVAVDLDAAQRRYDELTIRQAQLQKKLDRMAGSEVAVWAADSIAKAFDRENLRYPLTPKTQKPSFVKGWLDQHPHPMAQLIVEIRQLDKMRGTFLQGCILEGHVRGRIHCQFHQLKGEGGGAVSGRFSSSDPNLQFIPVRTDEGKLMRTMFVADEGEQFWHKDYSQIEYRLLVHDAADMGFRGGEEIAQRYIRDPETDFHKTLAEMTGLERGPAKTINFGLAYGEGVDKLCVQLGLSRQAGEALIAKYHRGAPFMKPLMNFCMRLAEKKGIVETILRRKRRFNAWAITKWDRKTGEKQVTMLRHKVPGARRAFTHKALNARTQGSAADIMKEAMVQTWESGVYDVLGVPALTVHDELDGSCPKTRAAKEALRECTHIMENCVRLRVPLKVDGSEGPNWGACK